MFEEDAIDKIHVYAGGVPRLINTIADNALFETFLRHDKLVSVKVVESVSEDLGLYKPETVRPEVPVFVEPLASSPVNIPDEDSHEDLEAIDSLLEGFQDS